MRTKITARRREKVIWIRCKSYEITRERVFIYYEKRILGRNCKTVRIFVYYFRINKTKVREKTVCNVVRPLRMKNETLPNYRGDKPNPVSTPRFLLLPNWDHAGYIEEPLLEILWILYTSLEPARPRITTSFVRSLITLRDPYLPKLDSHELLLQLLRNSCEIKLISVSSPSPTIHFRLKIYLHARDSRVYDIFLITYTPSGQPNCSTKAQKLSAHRPRIVPIVDAMTTRFPIMA